MLFLGPAPGRGLSTTIPSPIKFVPNPTLFTNNRKNRFFSTRSHTRRLNLSLAKADGGIDSGSATRQTPPRPTPFTSDETLFVAHESVPLEGVVQLEKTSSSSRIDNWGRVALLAVGDVLALLLFFAIWRFNHWLSVFDLETLRTADPYIAGWFLSAYFLGGYAEDGRGMNGFSKAVKTAAKSWALGIPLGLIISAATSGHIPPYMFILDTMGSTAVLLIGWRTLFFSVLPNDKDNKDDVYGCGSPFELFEGKRGVADLFYFQYINSNRRAAVDKDSATVVVQS